MPNRIIKESILTSPNFNQLSLLAAQHFFRILLRADDWGCLECTPAVIRGTCYPLMDSVTADKVDIWQKELEQVNIIRRWEDGGREFATFCQ